MPRPFRFGVMGESIRSGEELIGTASRAEALGYSTLLLRDHFVREPFGDQLAPMVALMAAAGATRMLRVGAQVLDNDYRHPVLLAKEAATLDLLSGGRLELGIGAGWLREEYERGGLPFEAAGVRISRLEEAIQIIKRFFNDETVTFSGNYYKITGLQGFPKPTQRPHPPFFIGGGGKRLLSLAAREADIVGVHIKVNADGTVDASERTEATLAQKVEWVRQAAGERFDALELNLLVSLVAITDDRRQTAEHYIR